MSSEDFSKDDIETINTDDLTPIDDLGLEPSASVSMDLVPANTQALDVLGQFGELAIATAGQPIPIGSVKTEVSGGDFQTANFGPVSQHNELTRIDHQQLTTNVYNIHQYGSDSKSIDGPDQLSTSAIQTKQEVQNPEELILPGGIKVLKSKIIYKADTGVTIYEGEKAKVDGVHKIAVKFLPHTKNAMREAQSLEAIRYHPNVVGIYDTGVHSTELGEYIFIAMELCSQESLFQYISRNSDFHCQQAISHSTQIISGIEYIHRKKVLHRDLKPQNVLFLDCDRRDQLKITDFGVSKNFLTDPLSTTNQTFGSQGYTSPEIIKGEACDDPTKTDIFSLGIILVFILSNGKHPYGDNHWFWTANIAMGKEPDLSKILFPNGGQRDAICRIILSMLHPNPDNRPSAADVLNKWNKDVVDYIEKQSDETKKKYRAAGSEAPAHTDTQIKEVADYAEEQAPESSKREEVSTSQRSTKTTDRKHEDVGQESRLVAQTHSEAQKKNVEKNIEKPASKVATYKNTDEGTRNSSASFKKTLAKSIKSWFMRESSKLDKATEKGAEGNTSSGHQHTQRKDDPGTIPIPCILGVTMRDLQVNQDHELICWKSLEDLKSKEPTVITELHEVQGVNFSVTVHMRSLYLLTSKKTCYELDLDDATKGLVKLGSMNHDHGVWPPAAVLNGKLYVCGKWHGSGESPSKKCEVFTGQWCDICELNIARNRSSVASYKGYLYSVGGRDGENDPLRSVERYDASNNKWELIQSLNVARDFAYPVVCNGKMYVLGGYDADVRWIPSYECFDSTTRTWTLHTSAWWMNNIPRFPFVFDDKVLSVLWTGGGYRTIGQVPLSDEDEEDLLKVQLPERWTLFRITAVE